MNKIKVKILQYGNLPEPINYDYIKKFKSSLFEITNYERFPLPNIQNGFDYCTYLDKHWEDLVKATDDTLTIVLTNAFLENNHYARHLSNHRIIFSFSLIYKYLRNAHICFENVILKALYEYTIIFETEALCKGYSYTGIWHNETRGCLFDTDGYLEDICITCREPQICDVCKGELLKSGISIDKIETAGRELKKLKISWVYRVLEWIERHPIYSIIITVISSICLSIIGSALYDLI